MLNVNNLAEQCISMPSHIESIISGLSLEEKKLIVEKINEDENLHAFLELVGGGLMIETLEEKEAREAAREAKDRRQDREYNRKHDIPRGWR